MIVCKTLFLLTDQLVVSKKKHYDSDKIRQYMAKQKVDRKRKQAECKRIKKEANDKRIKLLDNLNKRRKRKNVSLVNYSSIIFTHLYRRVNHNFILQQFNFKIIYLLTFVCSNLKFFKN